MGNSKNPTTGKRVFNDVYSFPQDSQDLADDIHDAWNVRRGSSAARLAFPEGQLREGLIWIETDTRVPYRWFSATSWQPTDAMTLLSAQALAGTGVANFDSVFSARFRNYLIRVNITSLSAGGQVAFRMRSGGNPATGGTDYLAVSRSNSGATVAGASVAASSGPLHKTNAAALYASINLLDPAITSRTIAQIESHAVGSSSAAEMGTISVQHNPTVAYDGFQLITSGPSMTGFVSVYGLG